MSRPDSCNGELPWPRQWGGSPLPPMTSDGRVSVAQTYINENGKRVGAHVSAERTKAGFTLAIQMPTAVGLLLRGEAVILRDLLNEVLEATS
jgi:hypothetical protein